MRKRLREVEIDRLEELRTTFNFSKRELAQLLSVSEAQIHCYYRCGLVPASRYYAARDALLISIEEESRKKREKILQLFKA